MSGWWLEDETKHRTYLSGVYQAGQSYSIRNTGGAVWNNDGDTAFLFSAQGQLIDSFAYSGGGVQTSR